MSPKRRRPPVDPARVLRKVKREIRQTVAELDAKWPRLGEKHQGHLEAMRHIQTLIENAEALG